MRLIAILRRLAPLLPLALWACQPILRTSYDFAPPATAEGRACIDQCDATKAGCGRSCDLQTPNCGNPILYPGSRMGKYDPGPLPPFKNSFGRMGDTDLDCTDLEPVLQSDRQCHESCDELYRQCYAKCGGTVVPHQECVAFCQ